jgi:predicted lipoprotein with Yx(FWY)xxD motif
MNRLGILGIAILIVLCTMFPQPVSSEWPFDPAVNVPICTANGKQSLWALAIVTDGAGGAIITWDDMRDGTSDVYAQRVDVNGVVQWQIDGVLVGDTADGFGWNSEVAAAPDGSGGAFIVWTDNGGADQDIRAQRIDTNGNILWPVGAPSTAGISVCSAVGDQLEIAAASDYDDGVYIVWTDERGMPTEKKLYAQRMRDNGTRHWAADGKQVVVHTGTRNESQPAIARDESIGDGVVIAWKDGRNSSVSNFDIYAQRMTQNGSRLWTDEGKDVTQADFGQEEPVIVGTPNGGAIVAWLDHRNYGSTDIDVYAQRMKSDDGTQLWEEDGRVVCDADRDQGFLDIASDGSAGAVIVWEDRRTDVTTLTDIYGQRISSDGNAMWHGGGVAICAAEEEQFRPAVAKVGDSKWIVVWSDHREGGTVAAQRYGIFGHRDDQLDGVPITLAQWEQERPVLVPMGIHDEAIVAWRDYRNGVLDVYAQGILFSIFRDGFESGDFGAWSDNFP